MDKSVPPASAAQRQRKPGGARAFWVRQIVSWHWITAAIALLAMLGFSITGITLNHAGDIPAQSVVTGERATLPAPLRAELANGAMDGRHMLPPQVASWVDDEFKMKVEGHEAEWSASEVYLAIQRPGGDAWVSIDRQTGAVEQEDTWRGWVAYFNDLHKGRNLGLTWTWFIDIFAGACILFALTGFGLLWLKAAPRPATWPLIGVGVLIPVLLALFFIH